MSSDESNTRHASILGVAFFLCEGALQVSGYTNQPLAICLLGLGFALFWWALLTGIGRFSSVPLANGGATIIGLGAIGISLFLVVTYRIAAPLAAADLRIPWSQSTFKISRDNGGTFKHCGRDRCVEFFVDPIATFPVDPEINTKERPGFSVRLENADFPSLNNECGIFDRLYLQNIPLIPWAWGSIRTEEVDIKIIVESVEFESVNLRIEFLDGTFVRTWNEAHTWFAMFEMSTSGDPNSSEPGKMRCRIEDRDTGKVEEGCVSHAGRPWTIAGRGRSSWCASLPFWFSFSVLREFAS